jgi:transglutaminase-like putative cysteine protease
MKLKTTFLKYTICIFAATLFLSQLDAAKYAVIISVRSGSQTLCDKNKDLCAKLHKLILQNGFDKKNISTFFEGGDSNLTNAIECSFDNISEQMSKLQSTLSPDDSLWIFIFGHANFNARGLSLASKGKRIKGTQLAEWLNKIKARQYIFGFNRQSAPLTDLLSTRNDRAVFTAASNTGYLNPPILPEFMINAWTKKPDAPIIELFSKASEEVENFYTSRGLAVAEVSQIFDGNQVTVFPFTKLLKNKKNIPPLLSASLTTTQMPTKLLAAVEQKKQKEQYNRIDGDSTPPDFSEFDQFHDDKENPELTIAELPPLQPPTEETIKAVKQAEKNALKYQNFNAYCPKDNTVFTVDIGGTTKTVTENYLYLIKDAAADHYAKKYFQDFPPSSNITIVNADIIYPDGSYRKVKDEVTPAPENNTRYHLLKFPATAKGCLLRYTIHYSEASQTQLHNYNKNFILQKTVPSSNVKLVIRTPKQQFFRYKLYNSKIKPVETSGEYSKIITFNIPSLPAMEPLPFDPPFRDCVTRIAISSMKNWQSFREWTERIMTGSDKIDKKTVEFAKKIARFAKTDSDKLKAIYEYICELRYETTPMGSRAFRPRLPAKVCFERYGDCKDKANALVALAGALGIKGNIALVNRMSSTDKDFPSWQFNHAVAFFPKLDKYPNGLWCDATDGSTPFASLPPGDIGRNAFILKKENFEFKKINTPTNNINSLSETITITINKNNTATASLKIKASGLSDYYLRQKLKYATPLSQIYIIQTIVNKSFTGLSVQSVKISPLEKISQPIEIEAVCSAENATLLMNAAIPPPMNLWQCVAAPDRNRPLLLNDGQQLTVDQKIEIKGKKPISFASKEEDAYCKTEVTFSKNNNCYVRYIKCTIKKPQIPPDDYKLFRHHIINWYTNMSSLKK